MTNDSPEIQRSISELMTLLYKTSNSTQPMEKQHPLIARLIEQGLLPLEKSNTILARDLYYPTKAFASLNAPIIIEAPISLCVCGAVSILEFSYCIDI